MLRNLLHIPRKSGAKLQHGFTMVELIAVMVIAGVLAAVVVPKFFSNSPFQARGFADQVQSTLRYAQKIAIAQHRNVCVSITSEDITLRIANASGATSLCNTCLDSPAGELPNCHSTIPTTYTISRPSTAITLSSSITPFGFDALGRPFDTPGASSHAQTTITISNATDSITSNIIVEAETGYVH